jgi:hypothetical protein
MILRTEQLIDGTFYDTFRARLNAQIWASSTLVSISTAAINSRQEQPREQN